VIPRDFDVLVTVLRINCYARGMASYDESLKVTCQLLRRHVKEPRPIRPTDNIQNDLGLDSLGVMEVVADIEDRFNVTIPTDVLSNIATVEDVAKALMKLGA